MEAEQEEPLPPLIVLQPPVTLTEASRIWERFGGERVPERAHPHEQEQTRDAGVRHPGSDMPGSSSAGLSPQWVRERGSVSGLQPQR